MKTTERFEKAVTKLYNAFHKGKLNAMYCDACAVGNMCDNDSSWASYVPVKSNYHRFRFKRDFNNRTGYS